MLHALRVLLGAACLCTAVPAYAELFIVDPNAVAWLRHEVLSHGKTVLRLNQEERVIRVATSPDVPCGEVTLSLDINARLIPLPPGSFHFNSAMVFKADCRLPYELQGGVVEITGAVEILLSPGGEVWPGKLPRLLDGDRTVFPQEVEVAKVLRAALDDIVSRQKMVAGQ